MRSVADQPSQRFTRAAYAELIARTAAIYPCLGLDVLAEPELPVRLCILRHDIDMDVEGALALATLEAQAGVRATYTILLTGEHYSPWQADQRQLLQRLPQLGHDVALHFDAAWHGIADEGALHAAVAREGAMLSDLVAARVTGFSFHNTTAFTMNCHADAYGGLWNAYAGRLQAQVSYTSDSNGFWRFRSWDDLLDECPPRIQVLTHPEWWTEQPFEPAEKTCRLLDGRARAAWAQYRNTLAAGGREIRTAHPSVLGSIPSALGSRGDDALRLWLSGHRSAALLELARLARARGLILPAACSDVVEELALGLLDPADPKLDEALETLAGAASARMRPVASAPKC